MALDTPDKRASAIGIGLPWARVLPRPEAFLDQGDRQQTAYSYRGILAGVLFPPQPCILDLCWSAEFITVLTWTMPVAELGWCVPSPETLHWCGCDELLSEPLHSRRQRSRAPIHAGD